MPGVSIRDGAPGRGSGRYPLGSGAQPYQDDPELSRKQKRSLKKINKFHKEVSSVLDARDKRNEKRRFKDDQKTINVLDKKMSVYDFNKEASKLARQFIDQCYDIELNKLYKDVEYKTKKTSMRDNALIAQLLGGMAANIAVSSMENAKRKNMSEYDDVNKSVYKNYSKKQQYMIDRYYKGK